MGDMKTRITIKQKNLQTKKEQTLCDQVCDLNFNENEYSFSYKEKAPLNGSVTMKGDLNGCSILRKAEGSTILNLIEKKKTKGIVESIYGILEIDLYTHHYYKKDELIAIEYDVLNGNEVVENYRLMVKFKKLA